MKSNQLNGLVTIDYFRWFIILIGLAIWFYYHRNKDSKYLLSAIIGILCFYLSWDSLARCASQQAAISQYSGAEHLMEQVAEDLGTSPKRSTSIRCQRSTEALSNPVTIIDSSALYP